MFAGVGDKIILRQALRELGLAALATKEKRAIQFGSHIGKLTNKRLFGSNRAANKQHAGSVSNRLVKVGQRHESLNLMPVCRFSALT